MKKILSLILLGTLLLVLIPVAKPHAKAAAQDTSASDVRIMSANVLAEFASWSGGTAPEATSSRVVKLNKMLEENNPIAVGTQEMSPSWYTAFKKLDSTKWGWLEESDVAGYSYYNYVPNKGLALNSILYRKDLLTLNAHGVEAYSSRSNGQCIVWGVFTLQSSGKQFVLISTHWTPGADKANERLVQAEQLAKKVNSLRNTYGDTVICTGDFNCNDQTQEFRRFLVNSNSVDSRTGAATRGDHLNKIDHVTATADASFSYHTICYEANGSYAISDHPFAVADVKLSSALLFDFTDSTDSRAHYKQGNYRYNAYDYHTAYWTYDSNLVSNRAINKSEGTLTFNVSAAGNPYIMATTTDTTDPKSAYGLNFDPKEAEVARVRFLLTNCEQINTATSPSVTVGVTNRASGKLATDKKSYSLATAKAGYVTLTIPLTKSGVWSVSQVDSIRVTFDNIKNGSVKIDSIYIGKNPVSPLNQALFFDYSNTSADQSRYGGTAYGGYQFDKASKGYWATMETSTTSDTVHSDYTINNTAGTLSVKVAQGLAYNSGNGKYGPWLTTTKTYGTYPGRTVSSQHPLQYDPGNAEVVQIFFKTQDCVLAAGSNPQVVVVYDYYTGSGTARGDYTMIGDYTLQNGTYQVVTIPLSDQFKNAEKITTFGLRFWHIKGTSSSAKVEIDYIYVGPEKGLPTKHVYDHKTTNPTCTAQGYASHTCRTCSYSYKDAYTDATGHSYSYKATTNPTTSATGVLTGTCSKCSGTTTVTLPKLNTTDYTKTTTTAATCTATGVDKYTWKTTTYGSFSFNATTAALGHSYTTKVTGPTCTAQGYTTYTCSRCSNSYQDAIVAAKGPTEVIDKAVAATCTATGLTEGKHCSVCDVVLTAQEVVPATGHAPVYTPKDADIHTTTCENCDHSEEVAHSYTDGKCICGQEEGKEPVLNNSLTIGHTLNLASDISVNFVVFKALLQDFDMDTVYMLTEMETYEGNTKTGTTTVKLLPVEQGDYYYFTLTGLTAIRMNDRLSSVLYGTKDGQPYYSATDEYSIATYAYSQMDKATMSESLKILCADLLRYGASAQIFKGYRTDALADAAMTEVHKTYLSDMDDITFGNHNRILNDLPQASVTWTGKSLNLESKVALKFVFSIPGYSGNLEDLSLRVSYTNIEGKTVTATVKELEIYSAANGQYAFSYSGLLAAELRSVVSVQVYEKDIPVSCTLQYSADTYGNNKTGPLLEVCKALFAYSDSAKAYFTT